MKKSLLVISLLLALLAFESAREQTVSAQTAPAPVSPMVNADRTVTFSLLAPSAESVSVNISGNPEQTPMSRSENGIWSATVGPLDPEIWEYSFVVDGVSMIDPGNSWIDERLRPKSSVVEVRDTESAFYEIQDVPHGVVSVHTFKSPSLGEMRTFQVYTPPGYDRTKQATYPVLYLMHGVSNDDRGWTVMGRANYILDNLIADRKALPMIVVMPNGQYPRTSGFGAAAFDRDLKEAVIPLVEASYRVRTDASGRAIVGLSMGGRQALEIGLKNQDIFAWMGIFSPALIDPAYQTEFIPYLDTANDKFRLFWCAIGEDDGLLSRYHPFTDLLDKRGVRYTSTISSGAHTWSVWRIYLRDISTLLFRQ
ncbi:alpha/beta hydrolase-fold protein [Candidatus Latescibacterota bacterium]